MNVKDDARGTVLRIERSSIYDGDGFCTVIFLKGCPLNCQWCSTPESQSFEIEHTDQETYGKIMSVEDVMKEVRKDSAFFFHSGGGMTLSGGEIFAQPEFTLALLRAAREECIRTCIESCFFAPWDVIAPFLPCAKTTFVDLKIIDPEKHKKHCGVSNDIILENLLRTNDGEEPFKLVVRIPIIPGINDSEEELAQMGEFCAKLSNLHYIQLLPYHRLGTDTYRKLGRTYLLKDVCAPTPAHMEKCREIVRKYVEVI